MAKMKVKLECMGNMEEAAKTHIQELRRNKFSIGADRPNPLTQDLHHAVTCLSAELYTKDVHFLMELIQNAEDNQYEASVQPTLEFALTTRDITGCGAIGTLLIFNNEVGFSRQNMESICSVGRSTKKGKKSQGFIGEKGIGFKSVFLVTKQPHIISNGYKVKFNEEPDKDCGIGYIVPEWISDESFIHKIRGVYGSEVLPATTIVLPLKKDKLKSVKVELSSLHPELLLFLSKLKRLHVHENSSDSKTADSVTAISIVNETNHVVLRDKEADSRVVHLSVKGRAGALEEKCQYYMWRQAFPVTPEAKACGRAHVDKWIVLLAFPFGNRLKRGTSSVGIFAFLPTSMVTNFPFVIQADFILTSSRETFVFDNKWNKGILECVPLAFINAFTSCVKEGSQLFTVGQAFEFLPSLNSPFVELNKVREAIRQKMVDSAIVPCETFTKLMTFCKPANAVRIPLSFRVILLKMMKAGVSLTGITTIKPSLVHMSLDQVKYDRCLDFLGVNQKHDWYEKLLAACNLVRQAPDDTYIELLHFLSQSSIYGIIDNIPLLKFTNGKSEIELCTVAQCKMGLRLMSQRLLYCAEPELHAWLQKCNMHFGCPNKMFFLPNSFQIALRKHPLGIKVSNWLCSYAGVVSCSAAAYGYWLCSSISHKVLEPCALITFSHFLYHSTIQKFITESDVSAILRTMPIIDGSGHARKERTVTLVPASGSKWVKLFGPSNPFLQVNYVDIGKAYDANGQFAGETTTGEKLLSFLMSHGGARDLPELLPPNLPVQVASSQMTTEQAFLLLDWIRFHITRGTHLPEKFTESIRSGKWMKTLSGVDSPSNCSLPTETGKAVLELVKNGLAGFSIVDEKFYGERIRSYTDELKFLGVQCGMKGVQVSVMDRFKLLASSPMNRETAFSLLLFMGFLKARQMLEDEWLNIIKQGNWLKTCRGYAAPRNSVFFYLGSEAVAAQKVTSLHVIDVDFYGSKLSSFIDELRLLGVKCDSDVYALVEKNLSFQENSLSMTSDCGFFIFNCLRKIKSPDTSFIEMLRNNPWLKTSIGFSCPSSAVLHEPNWACLLKIVNIAIIDETFYGNEIRSYADELKVIGVSVEFGDVLKMVINEIKTLLSSSMAQGHLISLLRCIAEMKKTMSLELVDMCTCLSEEEILKTRHGYKKPEESILFNSKWASISLFVDLPLIDDSYYGITIYGLRDELKMIGVLSSLEEGATFVAQGLIRPIETELLTAEGTLSLLCCLKNLMADGDKNPSFNTFLENLMKSEFCKTSCGYRLPKDTFLLHGDWKDLLQPTDAPFLDDKYYGTDMSAYLDELKAIGVKVDPMEVCYVLSQSLPFLSETPPIRRIYGFLKEFQWKPDSQGTDDWRIWVPAEETSSEGKWVDTNLCVLYDRAHHFAPTLISLDAYYEKDLLSFFSSAFGVLKSPSTSHYLQIWGFWELRESHELLDAECLFFWSYILKNWNPETENALKEKLAKVPAIMPDGGIVLSSIENVFVPDDLWLKKMFMDAGDSPLFVWFPQSSMFSVVPPVKLCAVYCALGVRKISETVECSVKIIQSPDQPTKTDLKSKLIVKGFIEMLLGFLACKIHMPIKERHEAVKSLLGLSVFENNENVQVCYELHLNADRCLRREVVKLVHWDKNSQKLFIHGTYPENLKASAEFVNFFAEEVAQGLLPQENVSVVNDFRNLIQMGFLFEFHEHSVQFLLTKENIEVLMEDGEFLAAAFPLSEGICASGLRKRAACLQEPFGPLTPTVSKCVKRSRLLDDIVSVGGEGNLRFHSVKAGSKLSSKKKVAAKTEPAKNPGKPKKPPNAFFVFMDEFRKQCLKQPRVKSLPEYKLSKAASESWRAMSDLEKAPYIELALRKKADYEKELEVHNRQMERQINCLDEGSQSGDGDDEEEPLLV